ncbi:MAG: DUF5615 family PIN-like protein [Bacteroidota bacterium]
MKFFVDANLPHKLALNLRDRGFDVLHTDDLPGKVKNHRQGNQAGFIRSGTNSNYKRF